MAAAAAVLLRKERDIVNIFRGAGATSAAAARDPGELGVDQRVAFGLLVRHGVMLDAGGDRYYADLVAWDRLHKRRRKVALILLGVVTLVTVALIILGVVTLH